MPEYVADVNLREAVGLYVEEGDSLLHEPFELRQALAENIADRWSRYSHEELVDAVYNMIEGWKVDTADDFSEVVRYTVPEAQTPL